MNKEQWDCGADLAPLVDEVNFQRSKPIVDGDINRKLRQGIIQSLLGLAPVKLVPPVCGQALDIGERSTVVPACLVQFRGKRCEREACLEVCDLRIWDGYLEGLWRHDDDKLKEVVQKYIYTAREPLRRWVC